MSEILNTEPIFGFNIDLSLFDRALSSKNISLKPQYERLISHLLKIHETGILHYSIATKSFELRIPDPILLKEDGFKELFSKHLYVNLTKYIEYQHSSPARCVKNGKIYSMVELLNMKPLRLRQDELPWDVEKFLSKYKQKTLVIPKTITSSNNEEETEFHGTCIPIIDLPNNHVAIQYLLSRGFDKSYIKNLYNQFKVSYCIEYKNNNMYKDLYKGLSKSPVGKIIFFIYHFGKYKGWQARRIEKEENGLIYHWHFDQNNHLNSSWIPVARVEYIQDKCDTSNNDTQQIKRKISLLPNVHRSIINSKYVIGFGTRASESILGFDSALDYNKDKNTKCIVIVEGAFDAAKFGPPACSCFGCRVSKKQALLLHNNFDIIYYVKDHDDAGNELEHSIKEEFASLNALNKLREIQYPSNFKDLGDIRDLEIINKIRLKNNI